MRASVVSTRSSFDSGDLSQAHSDHEAVELDQVTRGIAILVGFLSVN
jgi:acetylornithine deacetylase/succinyl-diaminopimelate desuccinylase-like protein